MLFRIPTHPRTVSAVSVSAVPRVGRAALRLFGHPNPFNPVTEIGFALAAAATVELAVYDTAGRLVAVLHGGELGAGDHAIAWHGRDGDGRPQRSGV